MTTYVLDSSAVKRFLDSEAGSDRVEEILEAHSAQIAVVAIPAVQWGEIAGIVRKRLGASGQTRALGILSQFQPRIVAATGERAVRAAELKVDRKLPYVGAFVADLAMDSAEHVLVTADFDFKCVADLARIEFLPPK